MTVGVCRGNNGLFPHSPAWELFQKISFYPLALRSVMWYTVGVFREVGNRKRPHDGGPPTERETED